MSAPRKVVILGGGVAGLSAAHELVERGFQVAAFEAQEVPGGKARSIAAPGTGTDGRKGLPGEHGFRFFPGFYRHVVDTMTRIPLPDGRNVAANLDETTRIGLARYDEEPLIVPARFPHGSAGLHVLLRDLVDRSTNISSEDKRFFLDRVWQILTSCEARRLDEYEKLGWWDFIGAASRSPEYQKYLCFGLTRTLVAAQPQRASTKTGGNILLQLVLGLIQPGAQCDRVLNGPTNEVWIDPWLVYLRQRGVEYHLGATVTAINCSAGVITSVTVEQDGRSFDVTGDYYIAALPVERMAPLVTPALIEADPRLGSIEKIQTHVQMMNGIQFFLNQDFPLVHGHTIYVDSPWALTSISQKQFWPNVDLSGYGDGTTRGVISVDISEWHQPGRTTGKPAIQCTPDEIAHEIWEELKHSWKALSNEHFQSWYLDSDISEKPMIDRDKEFLLVNEINTWGLRPNAFTRVPNLFLASDYVRTHTDLATMEAANEAARRAVNSIIYASGSSAPYCRLWTLHEPAIFAPWRDEDQQRYDLGLPWDGKPDWEEALRLHRLTRPIDSIIEKVIHANGRELTKAHSAAVATERVVSKAAHRFAGAVEHRRRGKTVDREPGPPATLEVDEK
jgi:uncharacterized protein with NAD-binding domain and iron-sulfur cluster